MKYEPTLQPSASPSDRLRLALRCEIRLSETEVHPNWTFFLAYHLVTKPTPTRQTHPRTQEQQRTECVLVLNDCLPGLKCNSRFASRSVFTPLPRSVVSHSVTMQLKQKGLLCCSS